MNEEKFELLKMWHAQMVLMNIDVDEILNYEYDSDDGESYMSLLAQHEQHLARLIKPEAEMRAVLLTNEMGVSFDDIETYVSYNEQLRDQAEQAEKQRAFDENHVIMALRDHKFRQVESKQYPTHYHFEFEDSNGLAIKGRSLRPAWNQMRTWLYWNDKKGKRQHFKIDCHLQDAILNFPKNSPVLWTQNYYNRATNNSQAAQVIAYKIIKRGMQKGFVYPKA